MYAVDAFAADRPAGIDDAGRVLTYGDIAATVTALAGTVQPRTLAVVLATNTIDFVQGCVALMNNGAVPMLLDAASDEAMVARYVATYDPEFAYVPVTMAGRFVGFREAERVGDYALLRAASRDRVPAHDDLALLLPTSGSTGSPKLVRQSADNLRANGAAIIEYLRLTPEERPITSLPMHYTYGYSVLNSHLQVGATLLLTERSVMEKAFWTFVAEASASSLAGVPYTYQMLQRLRFTRLELPSLRTMTQAGGKMAPTLIREFAEHAQRSGMAFYVMYGQTEATARMSYVPPELAVDKAGSIGIPIPGGEFFIIGDNGEIVDAPYDEGELGYCGPNVSMGYAEQRADLALGDSNGGRLLTGDVAYRDDDGFYYITGRRNRYVKVFGKRVSLDDIEQMVHAEADEGACLGVDDQIEVFLTDEGSVANVRRVLAERTGIHPSAFKVSVLAALPRTTSGKVDYRMLSEGAAPSSTKEEVR